MTAHVISLNQFPDLEQPARNYQFQIKGLIRQLKELIDEATKLLFPIQVKYNSSDNLLKSGNIALMDIKELHKLYSKRLLGVEAMVTALIIRKRKLNELYQDSFSPLLEERD
ncbi:hypothetical protein [Rickettsiella endosymbiont of Dermanyssus gallinae]|uniref:hypothetical protein n=1 Tax=Rickettsiella endosymbiont of Dermanyssus gallinae TaxID=2856608 RepID=UPI001C527814|nr:hypothetical protein [Rickettsiella endosymbiont of Dermanyssus gallinae]